MVAFQFPKKARISFARRSRLVLHIAPPALACLGVLRRAAETFASEKLAIEGFEPFRVLPDESAARM